MVATRPMPYPLIMIKDMHKTEVFIAGGGIAGLCAAAAFAKAGFEVICADPTPPITQRDSDGADLRTTALLQPARDFLDDIGVWSRFDAQATPLQIMRIVDAGGDTSDPRVAHEFDASDISDRPFGWNLPNWLLRRELLAHLASLTSVTFLGGVGVQRVVTRLTEARVTLSNGTRVHAQLVVGADGRKSVVRTAAGIDVTTTRFGQKALTFAVTHPLPHMNISTEVHRTGGPFTLVPLPDHEGVPCSAIVWMDTGPEITRLAALSDPELETAMTNRSAGLLGPLKLASRRAVWPIIAQQASRLTAKRIALVAEAAHVVPPIGAQGLNMSLSDIASLVRLAQDNRSDVGTAEVLDRYHRDRITDIRMRVAGITALNRASMASSPGMRDLRAAGLDLFYKAPAVRKRLMKLGLGARG